MVKIDIGYKPTLTDEAIMEILKKNLHYKIEVWPLIGSGISIWKNTFIGAIVKIKRSDQRTILSVEMNPPSAIIRIICCVFGLVCGLILLFLISGNFAKQVANEIKKIPEFQ
ncbi:MAG TPA: hypothetical protein VMX55_08665 [candidate division Zixibacteria bacterium]|nr:hypothetical protein [candidate division Zixibacteria bacterium]